MLDEFSEFCKTAGVLNDQFTTPEITYVFNKSILTSEDEVKQNNHCKASFTEFCEMLTRVANEGSYRPPSTTDYGEEADVEMSVEER